VASSGERKSSADYTALTPVREREKALHQQHAADLPRYAVRQSCWEAARKRILADKKLSHEAMQVDLEALGAAPAPPITPLLVCPEPSFEGLCWLLQDGLPSVGLFSSEGGQFIGGYAMSDDHWLSTAAALSALWDGEPIKRVRRGDGIIVLPGRRVAMHLLVQPGVANRLIGNRHLADQGLLSRMLSTAPVSAAGTRFWREPDPEGRFAISRYSSSILRILEHPPALAPGTLNALEPRRLGIRSRARAGYIGFADQIERQLAPDAALAPIRALASKLPEHAARLGAVLALIEDLERTELDVHSLQAGILLAEHYAAEASRLHEPGRLDPKLELAQRTLCWIKEHWAGAPFISLPDLYTRGPAAIREKATAQQIVSILEDHGWLVREHGPAKVNGTMRREVWRLVPEHRP
jgi:hypothetical protein